MNNLNISQTEYSDEGVVIGMGGRGDTRIFGAYVFIARSNCVGVLLKTQIEKESSG